MENPHEAPVTIRLILEKFWQEATMRRAAHRTSTK
jgi:hypothetical protein